MSIYVEIPIRASIDELWEKTQNPQLHQRWDLRFTQIDYLPRQANEPQRFLYRTRIGFGLNIEGQGESVGERDGEGGARTSSLKFWSEDSKSLIKVGSGYWKYVPVQVVSEGIAPDALPRARAVRRPPTSLKPACSHIRFFTWYDYETRFGTFGKLADACLFRPLLGWATAWSFDRLRLWIERDISPEVSRDRAIVYALSRGTMAFMWFYHGLVPKLLYQDKIELDLLSRIGTPGSSLHAATTIAGCGEVLFALLLVLLWRRSWPLWLTLAFMLIGIPVVTVCAPSYLTAAFNPLTLNLGIAVLALIAIISGRDLPTAAQCRREPPQ